MNSRKIATSLQGVRSLVRPFLILACLSAFLVSVSNFQTFIPKAYASGERYVYDYPDDQSTLKALKGTFQDKERDASSLKRTDVLAKGGVYGDKPVVFKYNRSLSDTYKHSASEFNLDGDPFVYSYSYICVNDKPQAGNEGSSDEVLYKIEVNLYLDLGPNWDTNDHNYYISVDSITKYDASTRGQVRSSHGYNVNEVDQSGINKSACLPSPYDANSTMKNIYKAADPTEWNTDSSPAQNSGAADSSGDGSSDACEGAAGFGKIGWAVCPIAEAMNGFINKLEGIISDLLTIGTDQIFDDSDPSSTGYAYHKAWSSFRTISLGIVFISALIVIIATALGYEILDAYTIRKVLPRVLVAIIFIALSWSVLDFIINLFNDIGNGIRALIYAPFSDMTQGYLNPTALTGMIVALLAGFIVLEPMGLLSLAFTALLAILIAFFVLMLRELVVIFLVIMSPVAIACMILPGTRKGWDIWQKTMVSMMVAFPIITGMIALGHVFSITTYNANPGNLVNQLVAFGAYVLPYFLLPFAFRLAGGLIGTLGGLANDRSRGVFDRLKKGRQERAATNTARMKAGNRFQGSMLGTRTASRMFNRTSAGLATGTKGRFGFGQRGYEALAQNRAIAGMDLMKDPKWAAVKDDDYALRAATYSNASAARQGIMDHLRRSNPGMSDAAREEAANHAVAAVQSSVGFGRPQALAAAQAMVDTGTAYHDLQDMSQTLARASGGNRSSSAALAGYANAKTKASGRHDLAPGFGTLNDLVSGEIEAAGGAGGPTAAAYHDARTDAWRSGSLYQHANDKPQNIDRAIEHFTPMLTSANVAEREEAAVFFNELQSMAPNASGAVQQSIEGALNATEADRTALFDNTHANYIGESAAGAHDREVRGPDVHVLDPATGNYTVQRGAPTGTRRESATERVARRARTYERIDPNRI